MERPSHGGNLSWAASLIQCDPKQILDFSASINPFGPPESALNILKDPIDLLGHYPDPNCTALKIALGNHHNIDPSWILPGNGAAELLTWVGRQFSQLDQSYLLVPGFNDYFRALKAHNLTIKPWHIDVLSQAPTLSISLESEISVQHAGCLLNNPHNPTGKRLDPDFIKSCLEQFEQVVIDEAFLDFLPLDQQDSAMQWLEDFPNLIILRSLTKFYHLPGLRIGYAVAQPTILQQWQEWRDPWSVNALAIEMGAACVRDQAFQEATWAWLPNARSHLFNYLNEIEQLHPLASSANFLLVKCDVSVTKLQQNLLRHHQILVRDCISFPELGDGYFRVAVLSQIQNERLISALKQELG